MNMKDCSNHKKEVAGISDMKELATHIGNLHYESFALLLSELAAKISMDGLKDDQAGRTRLAENLYMVSGYLVKASIFAEWAWQISKPFMTDKNPHPIKDEG